jgi:hypothetical protein
MKLQSIMVGLGISVVATIATVPLLVMAFRHWDDNGTFALCVLAIAVIAAVDHVTTPARRKLIEKWEGEDT